MKIILLLNHDIHSATALNLLFKTLENHQVKIILSNKVGNKTDLADGLIALKNFEQTKLNNLFASLDNKGLKEEGRFQTFKEIAKFFTQEIAIYDNINSNLAINNIKEFSPDLIISIRFGQILQSPVIAIPRLGVINLHSGILPKYRGIMSSFWAILNGDNEIGTTLHYIEDSRIDSGRIIKISRQPLQKNRSFIFNVASLYYNGCKAIANFINNIELALEPQSSMQSNYFSYPKEIDLEKFSKIMPLANEEDVAEIYKKWHN